MTYRDSFETCPRCQVALEDARAARGCRGCGGLWLDEAVLEEMVLAMRPQRPLDRLELAVIARTEPPLACPACKEPMHASTVHEIPIDRCSKHGVWFDALELETVLRRVAELGMPPPAPPPGPVVAVGRDSISGAPSSELARGFTFIVETPGEPSRTIEIDRDVIKIGRIASAHVQLEDPKVSRMHAIIEVRGPDDIAVIDLGSSEGTTVNGTRENLARLHSGDLIRVGDSKIRVYISR